MAKQITDLLALSDMSDSDLLLVREAATGVDKKIAWSAFRTEVPIAGHSVGLTLSNNATDANNDIDVAVGRCVDEDAEFTMALSAVLTKQLDAAWAEGDDAGGLDTGSKANDETYHVHLIRKDADGTIDALFSLSPTSPTLPSGWSSFRRLGAVLTDGSGNIIAFTQRGDEFLLDTPVRDVSSLASSATAASAALTVPTGIQVEALVVAHLGGASAAEYAMFYSPDQSDPTVSSSLFDLAADTGFSQSTSKRIRTNTSAQIRHRSAGANASINIDTHGWIDTRGKNAA